MTTGKVDRATISVGMTVAGLLLLVAARLASVDGLVRRVSIDGPSMAPALLGRHYAARCAACDFPFAFDADHVPPDERFVCPNCGFIHEQLPKNAIRPNQAVLIDRWPLFWRRPGRGEVVACRDPNGAATVKRVAWLPGERPQVLDGDLYDVERLIHKSPHEAQILKLLVHDDTYRPTNTAAESARWRGDNWTQEEDSYRLVTTADQENHHWLVYDQWPATLDAARRMTHSPITDNDPYNQSQTTRELNVVRDVAFTCLIAARDVFYVAARDGNRCLEVEVRPQEQAILRVEGNVALSRPLGRAHFRGPCAVEFGLCDQQVFLTLDGQLIFWYPYERDKRDRKETLHPLAIGAAEKGFEVSHLRVWRDIYYLDANGLSRGWQSGMRLGPREYALLGDNQPVSVDSRQWEHCAVPRVAIWGLVYRPFWRSAEHGNPAE